MEMAVTRARAVVRGRVQMVGFRAFVQRHAGAAGLRGTVRNRSDGSVETVLQGPADHVDQVLRLLHEGPSHARVDAVDVEYLDPAGDLPPMSVTS
jgi:acylphosphatase